jgi:hypothetical protein
MAKLAEIVAGMVWARRGRSSTTSSSMRDASSCRQHRHYGPEQAHGMGHDGVQKTLQRLRASCHTTTCCLGNSSTDALFVSATTSALDGGLVQPLDVPHTVCADIAMDFVEGFPKATSLSIHS